MYKRRDQKREYRLSNLPDNVYLSPACIFRFMNDEIPGGVDALFNLERIEPLVDKDWDKKLQEWWVASLCALGKHNQMGELYVRPIKDDPPDAECIKINLNDIKMEPYKIEVALCFKGNKYGNIKDEREILINKLTKGYDETTNIALFNAGLYISQLNLSELRDIIEKHNTKKYRVYYITQSTPDYAKKIQNEHERIIGPIPNKDKEWQNNHSKNIFMMYQLDSIQKTELIGHAEVKLDVIDYNLERLSDMYSNDGIELESNSTKVKASRYDLCVRNIRDIKLSL